MAKSSNTIEPPLFRRATMNPFKKTGSTSKLMKKMSRTISGQPTGSWRADSAISAITLDPPQACEYLPTPFMMLPPLSPTAITPPLSPCLSLLSSDSTSSSRSIPRKPVPEIDFSLLSTLAPVSAVKIPAGTEPVRDSDSDEDSKESLARRRIEVMDGLWTSTCDEREEWTFPSWYFKLPTFRPCAASKKSRLERLNPVKAKHPRSSASPPVPSLESHWLPTLRREVQSSSSSGLEDWFFLRNDDPDKSSIGTIDGPSRSSSTSTSRSPSTSSSVDCSLLSYSPSTSYSPPLDRKGSLARKPRPGGIEGYPRLGLSIQYSAGDRGEPCEDDSDEEVLVIRMPSTL